MKFLLILGGLYLITRIPAVSNVIVNFRSSKINGPEWVNRLPDAQTGVLPINTFSFSDE